MSRSTKRARDGVRTTDTKVAYSETAKWYAHTNHVRYTQTRAKRATHHVHMTHLPLRILRPADNISQDGEDRRPMQEVIVAVLESHSPAVQTQQYQRALAARRCGHSTGASQQAGHALQQTMESRPKLSQRTIVARGPITNTLTGGNAHSTAQGGSNATRTCTSSSSPQPSRAAHKGQPAAAVSTPDVCGGFEVRNAAVSHSTSSRESCCE